MRRFTEPCLIKKRPDRTDFDNLGDELRLDLTFIMLMRVLLAALLVTLSGCSEIRVETVRNGTLDCDETKTIGDVLDNRNLLSNGQWRYFDAEDGSLVVEFSGHIEGLQAEMESLQKEFKENPGALTMGALASGGEMGAVGLGMMLNSGMEILGCTFTIQFLMSKRDMERFEIGASSFTASVKLPNGEVVEETFDDPDGIILESLYESNKTTIAILVVSRVMVSGIFQKLMEQINR
jgi:hypothetical protein